MARQHSPLVSVDPTLGCRILPPASLGAGTHSDGYDEAWLQDLIFKHPTAMPIDELDPSFGPLIPICKELYTKAGYIDALFMNPLGMPTLVECKLWRSPEARREVVGQILDYARTLKKWTFSDIQREAARARKEQSFDLAAHVSNHTAGSNFDKAMFADSVSRNLQKGRVLLLVVGDGIREGVEAIAEYLQAATSLQFTFGLVEAQAFELAPKSWIVQSRVLARTLIINRTIVDVAAAGLIVSEDAPQTEDHGQLDDRQKWMLGFWTDLINWLKLDDKEQRSAKALAGSNIYYPLPTQGSLWITCYFNSGKSEAGVFLGYDKTSQSASEVIKRIEAEREAINSEFEESGLRLSWNHKPDGKLEVRTSTQFPSIRDDQYRQEERRWFSVAINAFVNVFRPRVAAAWEEFTVG
jgi:hypothetical protein